MTFAGEQFDLSDTQWKDMKDCKRDVEWLVQDEIAAAMRNTLSVTEQTLEMVAKHVKDSTNKHSCRYTKEALNYVFGASMSHEMFLEV